jgi:hypothetical protein
MKLLAYLVVLACVLGALIAGAMVSDRAALEAQLARDGVVYVDGRWQEGAR